MVDVYQIIDNSAPCRRIICCRPPVPDNLHPIWRQRSQRLHCALYLEYSALYLEYSALYLKYSALYLENVHISTDPENALCSLFTANFSSLMFTCSTVLYHTENV